jgi:hypothetical protein
VKLFQIEEPDGSPGDAEGPGAAIGIDLGGAHAGVAVAVGGNAVLLADRDGFVLDLAVPKPTAPAPEWQKIFEGARLRAERALGRPVTHAVVAVSMSPAPALAETLNRAAAAAGIVLLRVEIPAAGGDPALAAAVAAEDLAPRPEDG